jgi:hypothetical protein
MSSRGRFEWTGGPERKGDDMMFDQIGAAFAVAAIFIAPLAVLGWAALRYGADSRPGIGDRDQRPWLVPSK